MKVVLRCRYCGSTNIGRESLSYWDVEKQCWVHGDIYDDGFRRDCGAERKSFDEVEVPDGRSWLVADGKRSWLESAYRRTWPTLKPHIYLSNTGWRVRSMHFSRVRIYGPYSDLKTVYWAAQVEWGRNLYYINVRRRKHEKTQAHDRRTVP
jgi:hypothetical protein